MLLFQLISAKIAAEHHEEKRRQVSAELTAETETLKERLLLMESCQSELEAVQKRSLEIEMTAKNLQNEKTRLEKELENSAMQRARADGQVSEYKARISNLQQELDNSVAVQTDFVRLSQSLQMELEKIRQSEKEVCTIVIQYYGPSMMSQGKTRWKGPEGSFQLKFPHKSCKDPLGSFPVTSLTVHSV